MADAIWLADLTYTQQSISAESMPYGVACLASYASVIHADIDFRIFKYPERLAAALANEPSPLAIGFSHYIWNAQLSLAFARAIRKIYPKTIIVFGGPHYSLIDSEREDFLRAHPYIDFYVAGEGEVAFAELLGHLKEVGYDKHALHGSVASVHSIGTDGVACLPAIRPRMTDLGEMPPPYLTGLLDEFFDGALVPTLQTNRGCPFTCTFCVEGESYYHKIAKNRVELIRDQLHYIGRMMRSVIASGGRNELIITDSNFGMYPQDAEVCSIIADCQDDYGWPKYINATTGKNKRQQVLDAITKTRGAIQLTGSVQSLEPQVLENIRRKNIDTTVLTELALQARHVGAGSYSEVILGLPGDSLEAHRTTVRRLLESGFDSLTMFQLSLLPGSVLATPENRARFSMDTKYRVIPRCFGDYSVLGEHIAIAEIDEVCVSLDTLPFADYVDARVYDFYVAILHNHGPFGCVEIFLKQKGLSIADWIDAATTIQAPSDLQDAIALFVAETKAQLHDSRDEILRHVTNPQHIRRYIAGEWGNNEMYTYRAYVLLYAFHGLADVAFTALRQLCETRGIPLDVEDGAFVESMRRYVIARIEGAFELDSPDQIEIYLTHDLDRYERGDSELTPDACRYQSPRLVPLVLTKDQRDLLGAYANTLGLDERGIGRALTKSRLRHFLRQPPPTRGQID